MSWPVGAEAEAAVLVEAEAAEAPEEAVGPAEVVEAEAARPVVEAGEAAGSEAVAAEVLRVEVEAARPEAALPQAPAAAVAWR
jgi:hypothetical protein